jgi:hypothetical protein
MITCSQGDLAGAGYRAGGLERRRSYPNFDVWGDEVNIPIVGDPVSTQVWRRLWLPLIAVGAPFPVR